MTQDIREMKMNAYAATVWGPLWDQASPAEVAMRRDAAERLLMVGERLHSPDYEERVRAVEAEIAAAQ